MDNVICCLDKLNQGISVTAPDAAILSRATTPHVVKAAVLARLLHRPANHIETQLCAQLAAELPDVTATLRAAFPEQCSALTAPRLSPHPLATRMLRADWTDQAARRADLHTFLDEYVHERLPSHLVAAWLGIVMERGLSPECLHDLTHAMKKSGRIYDYRGAAPLAGRKLVRRYPTGGLSEKTALILPSVLVKAATKYPIASNFLVARSLGFTGGTWDKLSAIPGFRFPEPGDESIEVMSRCGVAMTVTHGDLNPADRKLYQLRSVTGTIESHELIVASIASKQLAVPADHLLLDVRYGEGAFLRSEVEARRCADAMLVVIAKGGVPCSAHLTDTPQPNGMAIGNALEVAEALATMGIGTSDYWDARALREQCELVLMGRISPIQAATIEAVGMTAAAAVWSELRGRAITLKDTRQWAPFSLLNAAALALLYLSLAQLDPIVVSLVGRSYVVVCAILGVFILHERLSVRDWSLIVLSTASTVMFIQGDAERVSPGGVALSMGYVVCFAFANLLAKRFASGAVPSTTLFWSRVLAAIALPVLGLALEGRAYLSLDWWAAGWVLGCSLITMFAGLWLYYRALATASFTLVNVLRTLGPIFVFFYSVPLMTHWPSVGQIIAGIVCIASIAILSLFPQRIAKSTHHSREFPKAEVKRT